MAAAEGQLLERRLRRHFRRLPGPCGGARGEDHGGGRCGSDEPASSAHRGQDERRTGGGGPSQPPQRECQIPRGLKALVGFFFQAVLDDLCESGGDRRLAGAQLRRIMLENCAQCLDRALTDERALPADHFIEHRPEAEDVAAMIRRLTANLFRRHVSGRAEYDAAGGVWLRDGPRDVVRRCGGLAQFRQAKIEDLHAAVVCDEDVFGLDVPVNDIPGVSGRDPVATAIAYSTAVRVTSAPWPRRSRNVRP